MEGSWLSKTHPGARTPRGNVEGGFPREQLGLVTLAGTQPWNPELRSFPRRQRQKRKGEALGVRTGFESLLGYLLAVEASMSYFSP